MSISHREIERLQNMVSYVKSKSLNMTILDETEKLCKNELQIAIDAEKAIAAKMNEIENVVRVITK